MKRTELLYLFKKKKGNGNAALVRKREKKMTELVAGPEHLESSSAPSG